MRQGTALYLAATFFGAFPFTPALARFDVTGTLDISFGTSGWRVIAVPEPSSPSLFAGDLVVLSYGTAYPLVRENGVLDYVVRIDALGDQDLSLDGDGAFAPPHDFIADIEVVNEVVTVSGIGEPGAVPGSPIEPGGIEVRCYSSTFSPDPAFAAGGGFAQYNDAFSGGLLASLRTAGGRLLVAGTAGADDQLPTSMARSLLGPRDDGLRPCLRPRPLHERVTPWPSK